MKHYEDNGQDVFYELQSCKKVCSKLKLEARVYTSSCYYMMCIHDQ